MKRIFPIYVLLMLISAAFLYSGCNKEDANEITISILKPTPDQVVANAGAVELHVKFEASVENHNVAVLIHKDGVASDVAFEWDLHDHDKVLELKETIDLSSYPSGTRFHMEVEACKDHDCEQKVFEDIEFSIP